MPVRASMSQLIAWTRDLIGDAAGPAQQWTDQQVQDRLDNRRADVRYELIEAGPTVVQNAANANHAVIIWADYYSAYHHWETDVVVQGNTPGVGAWLVLVPLASDFITGRFQFGLNPFTTDVAPLQFPSVYATGRVYDVYATAADLLEMRIASLVLSTFDFQAGAQRFNAGQVITNLRALALDYRRQAWITPIEVMRSDMAPTGESGLALDPIGVSIGSLGL